MNGGIEMNEGQNRLIEIINSVEGTVKDVKRNLDGNQVVKKKVSEIKHQLDEISKLAENKESVYKGYLSNLEEYKKDLEELRFETLVHNIESIAKLIIINLPDYLEEIKEEDWKIGEHQLSFELFIKDSTVDKKRKVGDKGLKVGEVIIGATSNPEENHEKDFTIMVSFKETSYTQKSETPFKLEYPDRIYKIIHHIHMNTSYRD